MVCVCVLFFPAEMILFIVIFLQDFESFWQID